ncbi:MAG: hypothetical protein ACRDV6_02600, partial [Acidimicrobiales bacterium]
MTRRAVVLVAVLSSTAFPVLGLSFDAGGATISNLQAQAAKFQQQIDAESAQIGIEGQRYDQAVGEINTLNNEIAQTTAQIAADQHHVAIDKVHLRKVALNSYMSDGAAVGPSPLFSGNQKTYAATQEYSQIAAGNLNVAVAQLHTAQVQLDAAKASLTSQQVQAQSQANAAAALKAAAAQQQAALNANLAQVKGQIGVLVAQAQAAANARAAARTQA